MVPSAPLKGLSDVKWWFTALHCMSLPNCSQSRTTSTSRLCKPSPCNMSYKNVQELDHRIRWLTQRSYHPHHTLIHPPTSSVRSIPEAASPIPYKRTGPPVEPSNQIHTTHHIPLFNSISIFIRSQPSPIKRNDNPNVHPPHLPLATLPPPTLHQHGYLLVRRSAPGSRSF